MIKIIISSVFIALTAQLGAQTGPGGVGNSTTNPYWIDVHSSAGSNGVAVSTLPDFSGNGSDANQPTVSLQPTYLTNAFNGVSGVDFDGSNSIKSGANAALNGNQYLDYYMFGKVTNTATLTLPFYLDYGAGGAQDLFTGFVTRLGALHSFGHFASNLRTSSLPSSLGFELYQGTYDVSNLVLTSSFNFTPGNTVLINDATPAVHEGTCLGGKTTSKFSTSVISEVFIFNTILNSAEENIVQNYISAKFGTAIANDMYDYEATHQFGVVGIGQDDASNNHLNSIGNGIVRISKNTLNNGDYLFVGHDGVDMSVLAFDVPVSMVNAARFSRVWRADEPTDIGAITLVFDLDVSSDFSADPNNYRLLIDHSDDDFSVVDLLLAGTYNAGTNEITFTNVDLQAGDFFTLAGDAPQDIISVNTGLWSVPATWNCTCVPTSFDKVTVDNGHIVTLDVDANVVDFTINPTGNLTWNSNENLIVTGPLVINGNLVMGASGELEMGSTVNDQTIDLSGSVVDFTNLTINNLATSVTLLNGTIQMNGTLSPDDGIFDYSAGNLIINSTSATTAGRVGPITVGASLVGNVTVKRFLPSGNADERTIASPVIGANLSEWDATISISGVGFPDGCAYGGNGCYQSCKRFQGGDFASSYIDVTNPSEPLGSGTGYELFIGDDLNTFSGATITSTGSLRDGSDYAFNAMSPGWNIVGNPFASPITFSTLGFFHIPKYYYVLDAQSGSYQWYDVASNQSSIPELANGVIAMGQGFWVNTGNAPVITYKQSDKTSSTATFMRSNETDGSIFLTLAEEGTTYKTIINVDFNSASIDGVDTLDIAAFTVGKQKASSIYINAENELLSKNYLNANGRDKVIDLSLKILNDGYFTISTANIENVYNYTNVTLIDMAMNEVIDLRQANGYTFYATEDDEVRQRFQLVLTNESIGENANSIFNTSNSNDAIVINQIGEAIDINADESIEGVSIISITNVLGQNVEYSENIEIQAGSNIVFLPNYLKGLYLITVKSENGIITKKIVL